MDPLETKLELALLRPYPSRKKSTSASGTPTSAYKTLTKA